LPVCRSTTRPTERALQTLAEVRASIDELDGLADRLARAAASGARSGAASRRARSGVAAAFTDVLLRRVSEPPVAME
jgi:hypothetical protein